MAGSGSGRDRAFWATTGRATCPSGVIPCRSVSDNVFFPGDRLSGLIDFYFACTDFLAYDLSVCLNAWCFEADGSFNVTKAKLLFQGYNQHRPIPGGAAGVPILAGGSALRFLLTRLMTGSTIPKAPS